MKTFSKVLSLLIVVVMCVGMLGTSAYAIDLFGDQSQPQAQTGAGGINLFDEPVAPTIPEQPAQPANQDGSIDLNVEGGADQPAETPATPKPSSDPMDLGLEANAAAGVKATVGSVGCKTATEVNEALANGAGTTIKLVDGANISGELIINRSATLDLGNGTVSGKVTVNAPLTVTSSGSSGLFSGSFNILSGGSVSVTGGRFATSVKVKDYITSDYKVVADGGYDKVIKKSDNPDVSAGTKAIAGSKECSDAAEVNAELAKGGITVKLVDNLSGNLEFLKGGTLDLNGYTLSGNITTYGTVRIIDSSNGSGLLTGTINKMNGSVVITGGTFTNDPSAYVSDPYTVTGSGPYKVVTKQSTYEAMIGSTGYATLQEAYDAATGGDTIVCLEDTSKAANLSLSGTINKNVNFQLGSNGLNGVTVNGANVTFSGGRISSVSVTNGGLTLSGSNVGTVTLANSTLNMGSGSIGTLNANSSKLYVSGGEITGSANITGTTTRAITGGTWQSPSPMDAFENSIADGYEKSGSNPYTIKAKSGGGGGGGGGGSVGGYIVSPTTYTLYSNVPVTVTMPDTDYTNFYYSLYSNGSSAYPIPNWTVSGYTLSLSTAWLNSLSPNTTYYLYVTKSSGAALMGSIYVQSGTPGPGPTPVGTWILQYVNGSKWYGGDDTLEFYSDLFVSGAAELPRVRIDTKSAPNKTISLEQYWENGTGYFKLGRNLMNSLSANEVYYIQVYDAAHPEQVSNILTFTLGPTLKPIDTDKHVINSTRNLRFLCSEQIARVYVGNIELTSDADFAVSYDRRTVTLSSEFLNKRTAGNTYTIKVLTYSGDYASCTFQILTTGQASSSPRTGDTSNIGLWAAFLLLSGTAVVVLLPKLRKHED